MHSLMIRTNKKGGASQPHSPEKVLDPLSESGSSNAVAASVLYAAQAWFQEKLSTIEEVRADLEAEGIAVPGVVVCGDQSAGKSSVLTSLTGITFPRNEDTCTRCPAIVQLQPDPKCTAEYAIIGTDPTLDTSRGAVRVDRLGDVSVHIDRLTKQLAPKGFSTDPIHIKVVRPDGPTFTLIDLPGIIRVGAGEDDGQDVEALTVGMVEQHIRDDRMVILVVIPASTDFQTAEALKLARKADPRGERTLGVITKIDKHDGEKIVERIHMEGPGTVKLKLGFVAVRNRTQKELDAGVGMQAAKRLEEDLFRSDPVLRKLRPEVRGVDALSQKIARLQAQAVDGFIPKIVRLLEKEIGELHDGLAGMGMPCDTFEQCLLQLTKLLTRVKQRLERSMAGADEGEDDDEDDDTELDEEEGEKGTLCAVAYDEANKMSTSLQADMPDFFGKDVSKRVEKEMHRYRGATLPNQLGSRIVQKLARKYLLKPLLRRSSELADDVDGLVRKAAIQAIENEAEAFKGIKERLKDEVGVLLTEKLGQAKEVLSALVEAEHHVGTLNPYYMDTVNKARSQVEQAAKAPPPLISSRSSSYHMASTSSAGAPGQTPPFPADFVAKWAQAQKAGMASNEQQAAFEHQVSLHAYVRVVLKAFADTAWKVTRSQLFDGFTRSLADDVVQRLGSDPQRLVELMREDADTAIRRAAMQERLERFERHLPRLKAAM